MAISSRKEPFTCSGFNCSGILSQVDPSFNLFRCVKCKGLQQVDRDLLIKELEEQSQ